MRGFSVEFTASQNWSYDYKHTFSASAGGGFSAFGINFGSDGGYSENTKEHQVDQSNTSLKFADDKNTLRFIGYAVAENAFFVNVRNESLESALGIRLSADGEFVAEVEDSGEPDEGGIVSRASA